MIFHMSIVQLIEFRLIQFLKHLVEGKLRLTSHFTFFSNDSFQACNKILNMFDLSDRTLSESEEKREIFR